MSKRAKEPTLEELRKQIPAYMWQAIEQSFDRGLKEHPEFYSEEDRLSFMARRVKETLKVKAYTAEMIRIAQLHEFDLQEFSKALGIFNPDTETVEIDETASMMLSHRLRLALEKHKKSEDWAPVRHGALLPKSFMGSA